MDGVLVNPAEQTGLTPEQFREFTEKMNELQRQYGLKVTVPKLPRDMDVNWKPSTEQEVAEMVAQAMADPNGSIIAFFPANKDGQRAVRIARELAKSPDRSYTYFTVHRTGISKGGVARNVGISVKMANMAEASKLKINQGDLALFGYNVEAKTGKSAEPEEEKVSGYDLDEF